MDVAPLTLKVPDRAIQTEADRLAERHFLTNAEALRHTQPEIMDAMASLPAGLSWMFARDGYLTAMEPNERWHTGCSVPLLAGRAMMKTLDPAAGVACFLNPAHAGQIRAALDRLHPSRAVICLIPDASRLPIMLRCDDYSADLSAGRLWFAHGEAWASALEQLFSAVPGLQTPSRFIRMPDAEQELVDKLVSEAQRVFSEVNARRTKLIAENRNAWTRRSATPSRVCVIARSAFNLWDDAGHALLATLKGDGEKTFDCRHFDPDAPAASTPLLLATLAADADAVIAANVARADALHLTAVELPWITWVTTGHIPSFTAPGPNDCLVLADSEWTGMALKAGWPAARVHIGVWPASAATSAQHSASPAPRLVLIGDTHDLTAPESLSEFSSHALLWDRLRHEILRDPFVVPTDVEAWLEAQVESVGIAKGAINVSLFIQRLILPAYQRAIAGMLIDAGFPLRLYGAGWAELARFQGHAAGAITTRTALEASVQASTALVHASPIRGAHPIDAQGRPVVRTVDTRKEGFFRVIRRALAGEAASATVGPPLSAMHLASILRAGT